MVFQGYFKDILSANPLNPLKLTLVQYQSDCYRVAFLKPYSLVFKGFFTDILAANPLNLLKLTLVHYQSDNFRVACFFKAIAWSSRLHRLLYADSSRHLFNQIKLTLVHYQSDW
jgi:hypothetical protein